MAGFRKRKRFARGGFRRRRGKRRFFRGKRKRFSRRLTNMGRPKSELKTFVIEFANQITDNLGDNFRPITFTQGTALNTRIGNSIFLKTLQLNIVLTADAAQAADHRTIRFTLVRYKSVFINVHPWISGGSLAVVYVPIDHWFNFTSGDFRVVWDKKISINPYFSGQERHMTFKKRWRVNKTIKWKNSVQASPDMNEYVLWTCDNDTSATPGHPTFSLYWVLRYYDS